jgi:methyltransferase-like protein
MNPDSYDEIPYDSTPIHETHPEQLAVRAWLFGLDPAPAARCRYLELGCASGGNLIPLACFLPESEFLGIERSSRQAAAGQALIASLGLRNVRIVAADVLDAGLDTLGQFDYVVAHGLYSWVPAAVRERLFGLMATTLAPHGVGYLSYNVYPGWRWRGLVRDLLRHAARGLTSPRARLDAACAAIPRYLAALDKSTDPIMAVVCEELRGLQPRHESYLYHEYLVDENTPVRFGEFMAAAERHGLQYLCESDLHTMFADGLPAAAQALIDEAGTLVDQEQTMDLLTDRLFRQTLLCRAGLELRRELDLDRFAELAWFSDLRAVDETDLKESRDQVFATPEGGRCVAQHPLTRAALLELADVHPQALMFPELAARAVERVQAAAGPVDDRESLLMELVRLLLRQYVHAMRRPDAWQRGDPARPRASALARAQAGAGLGHVATFRHKPLELDEFLEWLIPRLDGRLDRQGLVALVAENIGNGVVRAPVADADDAPPGALAAACVDRALDHLARHGVLLPAGTPS